MITLINVNNNNNNNRKPHLLQKPLIVESQKADEKISSSCEDIRRRGTYPEVPRSKIEENFPVAFIRVVYRVN